MYTQESDSYVAWAEEAGYSFAELLHQPVRVLQLFYNTVAWQGESLYSGMLGESLGNRDAVLNTPYVVILLLTACLVILVLKNAGRRDLYENKRTALDLVYLSGDLRSTDVFHASCMDAQKLQHGPGSPGKIHASTASCFAAYP